MRAFSGRVANIVVELQLSKSVKSRSNPNVSEGRIRSVLASVGCN